MNFSLVLIGCCLLFSHIISFAETKEIHQFISQEVCNLTTTPSIDFEITEGETVLVNSSLLCSQDGNYTLTITCRDESIARIDTDDSFQIIETLENEEYKLQFSIIGVSFGKTQVEFLISPQDGTPDFRLPDLEVLVLQQTKTIETVFLITIACSILFYNFGFGCKVQIKLIWKILKRPIGPAVGFCCQFLFMAPVALGLGQAFQLDDVRGLALLVMGSCPGGGGSNVFAYLFDADLELSITMTFISTLAALGMTPLWIYALGRVYTNDNPEITIPVANIFSSLGLVTVPVGCGMLFHHFKPKWAEKVTIGLKPFTGFMGVMVFGMGGYVYHESLARSPWNVPVSCFCLAACGYSTGFSVGYLFLRNTKMATTVAVETGFQNMGLAILMLGVSLQPPESTIAGVTPIWYVFVGSTIPSTSFIIYFCRNYIKNRNRYNVNEKDTNKTDAGEMENSISISVVTSEGSLVDMKPPEIEKDKT